MSKTLSVHTVTPRDLVDLAKENGYSVLPGRGKGSHIVMSKPGCPTIVIPGGKRMGRNVARRMLKALGA